MRNKGKIASWNDEQGYGFVEPADGGSRVFIHIKAFNAQHRRPAVNYLVTYTVARDKRGGLVQKLLRWRLPRGAAAVTCQGIFGPFQSSEDGFLVGSHEKGVSPINIRPGAIERSTI